MKKIKHISLAMAAGILFSSILFAGGPLQTLNGKSVQFKSNILTYKLDRGAFGIFTGKQARDLANSSFKVWDDVASSNVTFQHTDADTLPVDVNGTNFLNYTNLDSAKLDGINPIVFDSDGAITEALFGVGSSTEIIGFAYSEDRNNDGFLDEGEAFMNGKFADGTASSFTLAEWKSTFVHEFGHFLGLDHTQINGEYVDIAAKTIFIPTMYPTATADDVPLGNVNPDDIAAISALYPEPTFATSTGKISGSVMRINTSVVRGANVIAIGVGIDSLMNQVSAITDYYEQNNGDYIIVGLAPGSYIIRVEPIDPTFIGGSSVGPFAGDATGLSFKNPIKAEYYNGANESSDPAKDNPNEKTAVSVAAGNTTSGINIIANENGSTGSSLLTDDFNFSGQLSTNGWSVHSGTTNFISTTTGLTYSGHPGSGIGNAVLLSNLGGEDVNKAFTDQDVHGATIYSSILVNVTDGAASKTGDYFFHLGNRTSSTSFSSFAARLYARTVSGSVNFGISNLSTTNTQHYSSKSYSKNTPYLIILKYTLNTNGVDTIKMWVKSSGVPTSEVSAGTPDAIIDSVAQLGQDVINAVGIRQGSSTTSVGVVVDGMRISTDWPFTPTSVNDENMISQIPQMFTLMQNYPNPFNPTTVINYSIPQNLAGLKDLQGLHVTLKVYDILGKEVATLVNDVKEAGNYSFSFNGEQLSSGVYFYTLRSGRFVETKKMMLVR